MPGYKWDTDQIEILATKLIKQSKNLQSDKKKLLELSKKLGISWNSEVGQAFLQSMESDMKNLSEICKELDEWADLVKRANKECYQTFENNLRSKVKTLSQNIS